MNAIPSDLLKIIVGLSISRGTRHVNILLTCKTWNLALKKTAIWEDIQCIRVTTGLSIYQRANFPSILSIGNEVGLRYGYYNGKPIWNIFYGGQLLKHAIIVKTVTYATSGKPAKMKFISNGDIVEFFLFCIKADPIIFIKHWPESMQFAKLFEIIGLERSDCQFLVDYDPLTERKNSLY
jgi:hypothetical protein